MTVIAVCKTAVCNGDQLLDFLYRLSRSSSRQMLCSNRFDAMHVVCTDLLRVACIGLLSAEFPAVNTVLGRPMFWKPLCL